MFTCRSYGGTALKVGDVQRRCSLAENWSTPALLAGGYNFNTVTAMGGYTCGITTAGQAYCWGYGSNGRLGDGQTDRQTSPTPVTGGLLFSSLDGASQTCGATTQGAAYCWGRGGPKLGIGTN